ERAAALDPAGYAGKQRAPGAFCTGFPYLQRAGDGGAEDEIRERGHERLPLGDLRVLVAAVPAKERGPVLPGQREAAALCFRLRESTAGALQPAGQRGQVHARRGYGVATRGAAHVGAALQLPGA